MIASFEYCGIGLAADIPLPELNTLPSDASVALHVVTPERTMPGPRSWIHHWTGPSGVTLSLGHVKGQHVLRFPDGGVFAFDPGTRTVRILTAREETVRHELLDHVLPRVLDHLGNLMIHGSAIGTQRGAVIFIGDSGHGKSTLAASFQTAGFELLSDDCVRLTNSPGGGVECRRTYQSLRLWPDSARSVMVGSSSAPEDSHKRRLDLPRTSPMHGGKVAAICVLAAPDDSQAITLSASPPAQAVSWLLAQSFRLDPTDAPTTRRTFERCVDVVERVPLLQLSYPRDYDRLPEVRETVLRRLACDALNPT